MGTLQNSVADKTNKFQKVLAVGILAGVVYGAVKVLNNVIPPITELMKNMWELMLYGVPLVVIGLYVASNPLVIWGLFKTLSWKLTSFLIKMDPLSVMDRYVDYLKKKLNNLGLTVEVLRGKKIELDRAVKTKELKIQENLKLGKAATKTGDTQQASLYGTKIQTDQSTLNNLKPMQERAEKSLNFLTALADNWKYGIEKLEYQIEGKRQEYEIIRETTKGLKTAEDFINSDNQAARMYGMSVKALEETVTQQIGYIDEFERRSKDIMKNITIEKQAIQDEGLAVLEQYMLNDNLKLNLSGIEAIDYEEIPSGNQKVKKFNLLTKSN